MQSGSCYALQVFYTIRRLASGLRRNTDVACNIASPEFRCLIQTSAISGLFLVWHIDVDRDPADCRQVV